MKTGNFLKRSIGLAMGAIMCLSIPGLTALAAERTNPEYIDMYVSEGDSAVVRNKPEVVRKIAEDLFAHKSEIDLRGYNLSTSDFGVFSATIAVYPELFFVDRRFTFGYSGFYLTKIYPTYLYSESETNTMLSEFYAEADKYLEKVSGKLSKCGDDFSKALVLHDELVLDAHYDLATRDVYNFMINKSGVCENYARVYAYLLAQCGIYCEIVDSSAMKHEWMKLKLDGSYYNVDITWDDPTPDSPGEARHNFFLLSDSAIQKEILGDSHHDYSSLHASNNTKYDNYAYHDFTSKMCKLDADDTIVYAVGSNGIVKYDYSDNTTTTVLNINDIWYVSGSTTSYWPKKYLGLDNNNGLLYYNTPNSIRTFDPVTKATATVYSNDTSKKLYGVRISNNKLYGIFSDSPNDAGTVTFIKDLPPEKVTEPLVNESTISAETISVGEEVTITGAASGGEGSYTYTYMVRTNSSGSWSNIGSGDNLVFRADNAGTYEFKVIVSDGTNTTEKIFTLIAEELPELENNSTINSEKISLGSRITFNGDAKGGSGSYTYTYSYKRTSAKLWKTIGTEDTEATVVFFTPVALGDFDIKITAKDSKGNTAEKTFTVSVVDGKSTAFKNNSTINVTGAKPGTKIKLTGVAEGTGTYKYAFYYKRTTAKQWYIIGTEFSDTNMAQFTPKTEGEFNVKVDIIDENGEIVSRQFAVSISNDYAIETSMKNRSSIDTEIAPVDSRITITGAATRGTAPYKYAYYYKKAAAKNWKAIGEEFTDAKTASIKLRNEGDYIIKVCVKDSTGAMVSKNFDVTITAE